MIEDGEFAPEFAFRAPVQALRNISHDLTLSNPVRLADGTSATAIEIQAAIIEAAESYLDRVRARWCRRTRRSRCARGLA